MKVHQAVLLAGVAGVNPGVIWVRSDPFREGAEGGFPSGACAPGMSKLHSHCRGHMFDPCIAHHINQQLSHLRVAFLFPSMKKVWKRGVG